jgi:Protein of unknown function (DUF2946)
MMSRRVTRAGGRRYSTLARAAICLALLVAVLARGLIPAGFMPATSGKGGMVTVAMCSGMGEMQMPSVPGSDTAPRKSTNHDRCPFALVTAVAVLPVAQTISPPTYADWTVSRPALAHVFVESALWRPHAPPTGPPFLV